MKNNSLISVLMPIYNAEAYVSKAIRSILEQSYPHFELLIVDDCSTDGSIEYVKQFQDDRIKLFSNEKNLGYLKSINFLFDKSSGDYIAFQDADDWSHPDRLKSQLKVLTQSPISLCGTQCQRVNNRGGMSASHYPLSDYEIKGHAELGRTSLFCGSSIMFERDLLKVVGKFNPLFDRIGCEDIDWLLRAMCFRSVSNIKEALYFYRKTVNSISERISLNPMKYHSADLALTLHYMRTSGNVSGEIEMARKIISEIKKSYKEKPEKVYIMAMLEQLYLGNYSGVSECLGKLCAMKGWFFSAIILISGLPGACAVHMLPNSLVTFLTARKRRKRVKAMLVKMHG